MDGYLDPFHEMCLLHPLAVTPDPADTVTADVGASEFRLLDC